MKNISFALIMLILLNPISGESQDFKNIGAKQTDIEKYFNSFAQFYNKENKRKLKYKFEYSSGLDSTGSGKNKYKKFIKTDFIAYQTPFISYTDFYFFNEAGVCDSIIIYENVCLDCAIGEDSTSLIFQLHKWKKVSTNEFISNSRHFISSASKKNDLKCAYIKLTRDLLPENGVCRKWTLVLDEIKNLEKKEKLFYSIYDYDDPAYIWKSIKKIFWIFGATLLILSLF